MLERFLLSLAKFALTLWCGGAILFVLVTINDILSGQFETIELDQLVLLRFPIYYLFTAVVLSVGWLSGLGYWLISPHRWSTRLFFGCSTLGCLLLGIDYWAVYSPLHDMLLPLGSPRPQAFATYHQLTETLNTFALLFQLAAVFLSHFIPNRSRSSLATTE